MISDFMYHHPHPSILQEPELSYVYYRGIVKKKDHCYVGTRLRQPGLFQIPREAKAPSCLFEQTCTLSGGVVPPDISLGGSTWRTETYHYRRNHTLVEAPCCKPRIAWPSIPKVSRFLFYGDSTVRTHHGIDTLHNPSVSQPFPSCLP